MPPTMADGGSLPPHVGADLGADLGLGLPRRLVEQLERDVSSWQEIRVTLLFTLLTSLVFLGLFEFCRRKPSVAAVFDRRRYFKPTRTPPPLIQSRYLEWLFLSADPAYSEYSEMVHARDVIRERRRQRLIASQARSGLAGIARGSFPVRLPSWEKGPGDEEADNVDVEAAAGAQAEVAVAVAVGAEAESPGGGASPSSSAPRRRVNFREGQTYIDLEEAAVGGGWEAPSPPDADGLPVLVPTDSSLMLTPDVAFVGGRRLPAEVSEYAIAGDLTDEQLDEYERRLLDLEREEEARYRDRRAELAERWGRRRTGGLVAGVGVGVGMGMGHFPAPSDGGEEEVHDELEDLVVRPPSRLAYSGFQRVNTKGRKSGGGTVVPPRSSDGRRASPQAAPGEGPPDGEGEGEAGPEAEAATGEGSSKYDPAPTRGRLRPGLERGGDSVRALTGALSSAITTTLRTAGAIGGGGGMNRESAAVTSWRTAPYVSKHVNRHLKSFGFAKKRSLTVSDQELLRCTGLDTFVMIRFLRFGFDVTFYPFLMGCFFLFPVYRTNPWDGISTEEGVEPTLVDGYFSVTMNSLEPRSPRLWVCWFFGFAFFAWILRRQWMEWETFITLRYNFLANGDVEVEEDPTSIEVMRRRLGLGGTDLIAQKDDVQLHLEQYRNSVIVEHIPESHRRDRELYEFFDAVFPNQVKRAEVLLNCSILTKLIKVRQSYIVKYEDFYAQQFHEKQAYWRGTENPPSEEDTGTCDYLCCGCFGNDPPKKPQEPKIRVDKRKWRGKWCCGKRMVKALPYYLSEIKRLNREIEKEHLRIVEQKQKLEDKDGGGRLFKSTIAHGIKFATGVKSSELTCQTGFVEFKSLTAKQSALQCNLTGITNSMETISAPDPRDVAWNNATVEADTIRVKKMQCDALLFTGTLFWSVVVTAITSFSNLDRLGGVFPAWMIPREGTFWYGLIQGYLPVVLLELLMFFLPIVLRMIGTIYIRFKTKSETDRFVFRWHFGYRVANLAIIIVKNQIFETFTELRTNPTVAIETLAGGLSLSSQFFLNNMIVATGTECLWELAQMPQMIRYFLMHKFIKVEAKSRRYLDKLEKPGSFQWGHVVPQFIFAFLIASVYAVSVPIVVGVCSAYFYIATKVYTHQALLVYSQPYEGGGKLMYYLNRTTFVIVYISIAVFAINLGLKGGAGLQAPSFFVLMTLITYLVDRNIAQSFVKPSSSLALTDARFVDEDNARKAARLQRYREYKEQKAERKRAEREARGRTSRVDDEEEDVAGAPPQSPAKDGNGGTAEERGRRRRRAEAGIASAGRSTSTLGSGVGDEEDGDMGDSFYLYRQPQLNKSLWETKPRAYR